jgi:putative ATP-dependent endonuclease of OLD family
MCFDVDGVDGQLVIVTHSTDSLVDNYRNLIRFYKEEDTTRALSGPTLNLTNTNEKHLLKHFPEIKEAFYSHCAILIEGDTEYGCMKEFANKLEISLDECEISVINAGGEHSIKPLRQLLQAFGIPSVVIYDKDVKQGQAPGDCEFFTRELCFEIEIVKNLYNQNRTDLVREIARELDPGGETVLLDLDFIKKHYTKMHVDTSSYVPKKLSDVLDTDAEEFCNMYSAWYMVKKGVLLGRTIGEILPAELIPACYADAIRKAREVATNV